MGVSRVSMVPSYPAPWLPPQLKAEIDRAVEQSDQDMM